MVDAARLQLAYTTIRAPMDGRTGNLLVQAGNVVKANEDSPLVVIAQVHPIYVSFAVPEQHLADIKRYRARGRAQGRGAAVDGGSGRAAGRAHLREQHRGPDHRHHPAQGHLPEHRQRAVARASSSTWSSRSRARTRSWCRRRRSRPGQQGPFVFVVKPDLTVESRPVKVGPAAARASWSIDEGPRRGRARGDRRPAPAGARAPRVEIKPPRAVVNTDLFIRRPVLTTLLMAAIVLFGAHGLPAAAGERPAERRLPDHPGHRRTLPGASPETMASAVATPLERQFSTIAGIDSMTSTSALGVDADHASSSRSSRNIDAAAQDVQAAIAKAAPLLPPDMPTPPIYQKVNPADQPVLYLALSSPTLPLYTVDEYAQTILAQRISTISGVAQVQRLRLAEVRGARAGRSARARRARHRHRRSRAGHRARQRQPADRHALRRRTRPSTCRPPASS